MNEKELVVARRYIADLKKTPEELEKDQRDARKIEKFSRDPIVRMVLSPEQARQVQKYQRELRRSATKMTVVDEVKLWR